MKQNRILLTVAAATLALTVSCGEEDIPVPTTPDTPTTSTERTWPAGALTGRDDCLDDTVHDYFENAYVVYYSASISRDSFETMLPAPFSEFRMHHPYRPDAVPPNGTYMVLSEVGRTESLELLKGVDGVYAIEHIYHNKDLPSWDGWIWGTAFEPTATINTLWSLSQSAQRQDSTQIMQMADSLNMVLTGVVKKTYWMELTFRTDHSPVNAVTAAHIMKERIDRGGHVPKRNYEMEDIITEQQ